MTDNQKFLLRRLHAEYPIKTPLTVEFREHGVTVDGETYDWEPSTKVLSILKKAIDEVYQEKSAVKKQNKLIEVNKLHRELRILHKSELSQDEINFMDQLMIHVAADVLGVDISKMVKDK